MEETTNQVNSEQLTANSQKSIHWLAIFLTVIFISAIVAGAYWLGTQSVAPVPTKITVVTPTLTPTLDPTADWKTYSNLNVPFTFKYPSELSYLTQDVDESNKIILVRVENFANTPPFPSDWETNDKYFSFWIDGHPGVDLQSFLEDPGVLNKAGREKILVDGVEVWEGTGFVHGADGFKMAVFQYKDWVFSVTAPRKSSKNFSWFDQILATFKFLP